MYDFMPGGIIAEGLRFFNFAAARPLSTIPVYPLFYHKAQGKEPKENVHGFGGHFYPADAGGTGAFQVHLVLGFPDGGANEGIMTEMLPAACTV